MHCGKNLIAYLFQFFNAREKSFDFALLLFFLLIICIYKFLHSDWQRACQLIPNNAKFECRKTKLVQIVEIKNE